MIEEDCFCFLAELCLLDDLSLSSSFLETGDLKDSIMATSSPLWFLEEAEPWKFGSLLALPGFSLSCSNEF
jgi:hypothetical protein